MKRAPHRGPGGRAVSAARRDALRRRLLGWWDSGHRDLPWRFPQHGADPYRVWLAEIMLQQTQVDAVVPYYLRFVGRFPSLEALAAAREEDVLAAWSGLGYYARARRLHAAARETLRRHGGLPPSLAALAELPGLGPYSAGAVASIAFGIRVPAVDGNATRVLSRLFLVEGPPAASSSRARVARLAEELVPGDRPGDFNQALMELGATVCGKPRPACPRCPLRRGCEARRAGRESEVPPARRRRGRQPLLLACALCERRGEILVARRPLRGLFAGLWELPSVEVPGSLHPRDALRAGLRARSLAVEVGPEVATLERALTHRDLELRAFRCELLGTPHRGQGLRWAGRAALASLGMATAMRELIALA